MKVSVKEVLCAAARALGIEKEVNMYLDGDETSLGQRDTEILVECFNRVENDLALEYLLLNAEEEVESQTGVIPYSSFSRPVTRILSVEGKDGASVKYKLFPDRLETQAGKVCIAYTYAPSEKTLEDNGEYEHAVASRLFLYGMAMEYCLTAGELENADAWDKKYREALRAACKPRAVKRMRARGWL